MNAQSCWILKWMGRGGDTGFHSCQLTTAGTASSLNKVEDWNTVIWSNKSQFFLLLHADVRVRIRIFEFKQLWQWWRLIEDNLYHLGK